MRRTLILKIEKRPTLIVGLGSLGVGVVDEFFNLLPVNFRNEAPISQITPTAAQGIPEAHRPRGTQATIRFLLSRALSVLPAQGDTSLDDEDAVPFGPETEGAGSAPVTGTLDPPEERIPTFAESGERFQDKSPIRPRRSDSRQPLKAVVVTSPFEELPTSLSRTCSMIEEDARAAGYKSVEVDFMLLGDVVPGPATKRKAEMVVEDLIMHLTTPQKEDRTIKVTHTFFWVDHTNERGNSYRKDPDAYRFIAVSTLEALLSPIRSAMGPPAAAGLERLKEASAADIPVSSLGYFVVEIPVDTVARITTMRRLAKHLTTLSDTRSTETPEGLMTEIGKIISVDRERFAKKVMRGSAPDSALRLARRLSGLPSAKFMLGGDPEPELSTIQAGLENLLDQARWQVASGHAAQRTAEQQIVQVEGILDKHVDSSAYGLSEALTAVKGILDAWRNRESESFSILERYNHDLEQLGRRVAWLTEENTRRSQRPSWKNPVTSVFIKSTLVAVVLASIAFAAAWFLPGLRDILPGLVGATAGGSFLTAMILFMMQNFKERGVIPELLHETGAYAERRLDIITEEEYLKYLQAMNSQLSTLGAELSSVTDRLDRAASGIMTEASALSKSLGGQENELHRVFPVNNEEVNAISERVFPVDDSKELLDRICPRLPRGRDALDATKEGALRLARETIVPRLRSDPDLHPLSVMQKLGPRELAWEELLNVHAADAAPWWKGGRKRRARKDPSIVTRPSRRGFDIEQHNFIAVSPGAPGGFYIPKGEAGFIPVDAAAGHIIAIYPTVTGIPMGFAMGLQKEDA